MFVVMVKFRDENGEVQTGELVNTFKIMVEPGGEKLHVDQENPVDIDVITWDGGEVLAMHRIPSLAIVGVREIALA